MQHFNVKIFARDAAINLADAIPVFHRWIQDRVCEELLIDVADYRHVPEGPGVVLVGHEASYSLDQAEGRLGLLYNRKSVLEGSVEDKLRQAYGAAVRACRRLEQEPAFRGKLRFDTGDCEVLVNDRLLAPNTEQTWQAMRPELERFFTEVFGATPFRLDWRPDPGERFRVAVRTAATVDAATLATVGEIAGQNQKM